MTNPMGFLAAAASQLARIQPRLLIQSPIPKLQHFMLTFCQCGVGSLLAAPSQSCAIWTSSAKTSAGLDGCLPLTATFTPPPSLLTAAECQVMRTALVFLALLRNQMRCLCRQVIVLADLLAGTEGTPTALPPFPVRPAVWGCQPVVWIAIWTLTTGPPDLGAGVGLDDNIPEVSIPGMVPLALQKRAEEVDVWAWLILGGKSCGGEQSELRQAVQYWKMYAKSWAAADRLWEDATLMCWRHMQVCGLVQVRVLQQ